MSWSDNANSTFPQDGGDNRDDNLLTEEMPTMRSVAMLGSMSHSLLGQAPLESTKFGNLASVDKGPVGISKPVKGIKSAQRESFGVKQEWSAVAFNSPAWDVCGSELEMVPADFPLERTHREIKEDASIVASRISEALRLHSIQTEFDCKNAKAKCVTQDCVTFRIRLYAGGENGQPVVVEVQRRSGSASSFMRSCRSILLAAEGNDITKEKVDKSIVPPFVKKPVWQMACIPKQIVSEEKNEKEAMAALEGVIDMIRANRADLTLLGLESLCYITDPLKTSPTTALKISKDIMMGRDSYDIREEIRVMTERDSFVPEFDQDGTPNHSEHFRQLALRVFSNCLSICNQDGFLVSIVKEQTWFRDNLIPSLVDELKRAKTASNNAYEAASCVSSLVSCSEVATKSFIANGGIVSLEEAHAYGTLHHELLAEEARRCLDILKN